MTQSTTYVESSVAPRRTLARDKVEEITRSIEAFDAQIDQRDAEILRATEMLHQGWRSPDAATIVANDLEAMHGRQRLARQLRDAAERERELYERQVKADQIAERRAAFDSLMTTRTAKSRDLVAAIHMACALLLELDTISGQGAALFSGVPIDDGLEYNAIRADLGRFDAQPFIEELFAQTLPQRYWHDERPVWAPVNVPDRLPAAVDAERLTVLDRVDKALERVTQGVQLGEDPGPAAAAMARHDAVSQRAEAGHRANARPADHVAEA